MADADTDLTSNIARLTGYAEGLTAAAGFIDLASLALTERLMALAWPAAGMMPEQYLEASQDFALACHRTFLTAMRGIEVARQEAAAAVVLLTVPDGDGARH